MSKALKNIEKRVKEKREYLDEIIQDFNRKNNSSDEELIKKVSKELTVLLREQAAIEATDENGNVPYQFVK